ncbi:MAG: methylenetetrahydrofolate reductase [Deltaproteobacteria bacterium]|nr:methylenetetrahydrofolate reductase [Deltaproteobacteria bacterium]
MSKLEKELKDSHFVITSEIAPPKGPDLKEFFEAARAIKDRVVSVNVTDNQRSMMRLSSLVASHFLIKEGIEPIYQLACRDRNRLALQSDLLGAAALGIENILPLTGDPVKAGDQPEAKGVFDFHSIRLMETVQKLCQGLSDSGTKLNASCRFFVGGAVDPNRFGSEAFEKKLKEKVAAGAKFFQSQPVYDWGKAKALKALADTLGVKVLFGVILIKSAKQARFLNKIPGIVIPEDLIEKFEKAHRPLEVGVAYAAEEIKRFQDFAHGVHVMTVGREDLVPAILDQAAL